MNSIQSYLSKKLIKFYSIYCNISSSSNNFRSTSKLYVLSNVSQMKNSLQVLTLDKTTYNRFGNMQVQDLTTILLSDTPCGLCPVIALYSFVCSNNSFWCTFYGIKQWRYLYLQGCSIYVYNSRFDNHLVLIYLYYLFRHCDDMVITNRSLLPYYY